MKALIQLLGATIRSWREDKAPRLGASLAYYTIFSIPPLLMLLIGMASIAFGRDAVYRSGLHVCTHALQS